MSDKYILDGKKAVPCNDPHVWAQWLENHDWHVADETVGDARVSTVFLGIDHRYSIGDPAPVLFETMVFGGPLDQEQERYSTWEEAEAGHRAMVQLVKDTQGSPTDQP